MNRISAFLPLLAVVLVVGAALWFYPVAGSRAVVTWPAVREYFKGPFADHGFELACEWDQSVSCQVTWQAGGGSARVPVYACHDETELRRDDVFARFEAAASRQVQPEIVAATLGVLDGFFQSGLRRTCDGVVRQARARISLTAGLSPFELEDLAGPSRAQKVRDLQPAYGTILTGLPSRPSYIGDFVAPAVWTAGGGSDLSLVRLIRREEELSAVSLDPDAPDSCSPLWPDGPGRGDCRSVSVHPCDPMSQGACREPILGLHALTGGRVAIRVGRSPNGRLLSHALETMNQDELLVFGGGGDALDRLFVLGTPDHPGFTLELAADDLLPVSRLRLLNGRWQRWSEPTIAAWIDPVVRRYEALAGEGEIPASTRVELAVNMGLQHELQDLLSEWMSRNVEPRVREHLRGFHYSRQAHSLKALAGESRHRDPVPQAGITVLDPATGSILAVASYPPAEALAVAGGEQVFAPGWRGRLVGAGAPSWAVREILEIVRDRIVDESNANFVQHPIGSAFKPILLSLMIDGDPPQGPADDLGRLFDLVIAGHVGTDRQRNGGDRQPPECGTCANRAVEAIAGLPAGPWGSEEAGGHGGRSWVGRSEFLVGSCNKYAVTLGVLSLLDWRQRNNRQACCWNPRRDGFGFVARQPAAGASPAPGRPVVSPGRLPALGPWSEIWNDRLASNSDLPDAPVFSRLHAYYGVSPRSRPSIFDSDPWMACAGLAQASGPVGTVGRVAATQLYLTSYPVGASFTNIFTGSGRNWWTNVKLAEAYGRLAINRRIQASLCRGAIHGSDMFQDIGRHRELVQILSQQRSAPWVETDLIDAWHAEDRARRVTLSKTGTSLRHARHDNTGVFAIFLGEVAARSGSRPSEVGSGLIVVAHVDDVGSSRAVTRLVDEVLPVIRRRVTP